MIELYFLIYRIPKMMTELARERHRSALAWSLIGIGSWLGAEFIVLFSFGMVYEMGKIFWGWPQKEPAGLLFLLYVAALAAAIGGFTIARRVLYSMSGDEEPPYTPPPPPPRF
jgi:hypothetical protein